MDFYLHKVHRGVVSYARRSGWILDTSLCTGRWKQVPPGWDGDGVLTYATKPDQIAAGARQLRLPTVNMSLFHPGWHVPTVVLDNPQGGRLAAECLIARGINHLAMIQASPESPTSAARRRGFEAAVAAAGRRFYPAALPGADWEASSGEYTRYMLWMRELLLSLPRPIGVLTEGDAAGVEVIEVCRDLGLAVPQEVAVIGFDNDDLEVEVAAIPLSSVDNDQQSLGFRAAELLGRLMAGEPPPREPVLIPPIGVVERQSTNVLALTDPDVIAAMQFIRARATEPIGVDDVVEQTDTYRRRLQDLFVEQVGRPIVEEIRHCRMDKAKQLLRETSLKLSSVAERSGFGTALQLGKVFTRTEGMSPGRYRQQHIQR